MKKILTIIGLAAVTLAGAQAQVVFAQDFASGGTTATYVNAAPTTGQWNAIGTSGAAKVWSINSNTLQIVSTGANGGAVSRTTNFSPVPSALLATFTFNLVSSSTALTQAIGMYFGSAFDTTNSAPANADVHSRFAIGTTASNQWFIRQIGVSNSSNFTGSQTISLFTNNSGAAIDYSNPSSGTSSLANDRWDIWVGTTAVFTNIAAQTASQTLSDWKFVADGSGTYTGQFDNFNVSVIPEPTTSLLLGLGSAFMLWNLRRRRSIVA